MLLLSVLDCGGVLVELLGLVWLLFALGLDWLPMPDGELFMFVLLLLVPAID